MDMRIQEFRLESELSASFRQHANPALWTRKPRGNWARTDESRCSEGRADIVWGRFEKGSSPAKLRQHSALLQNPTASRVLATLHQGLAQSEDDLKRRIGVTTPVLRRWLRALRDARLVTLTQDERYRAAPRKTLVPAEICSFELKLRNWRRALYQATRYRSFSHRVFVVMPAENANTAYKHGETFRKANIGLVAHEASGQSRVLIRPQKRKPHARYRTIMALGMLCELSS